jgi:hypothetical protein
MGVFLEVENPLYAERFREQNAIHAREIMHRETPLAFGAAIVHDKQ